MKRTERNEMKERVERDTEADFQSTSETKGEAPTLKQSTLKYNKKQKRQKNFKRGEPRSFGKIERV